MKKNARVNRTVVEARDFEDLNVTTEAQEALHWDRAIEPRVERLERDPKRHFSRSENVTSSAQGMSRQQYGECHVIRSENDTSADCHVDNRARP